MASLAGVSRRSRVNWPPTLAVGAASRLSLHEMSPSAPHVDPYVKVEFDQRGFVAATDGSCFQTACAKIRGNAVRRQRGIARPVPASGAQ